MPRPKSLKPSYCHHKSSGRAFVTLDGNRVYLGPYGSQESRDRYDRAIGEWIARGRTTPPPSAAAEPAADGQPPTGLTVFELIDRYWTHATAYYVGPDGNPTSEIDALRP